MPDQGIGRRLLGRGNRLGEKNALGGGWTLDSGRQMVAVMRAALDGRRATTPLLSNRRRVDTNRFGACSLWCDFALAPPRSPATAVGRVGTTTACELGNAPSLTFAVPPPALRLGLPHPKPGAGERRSCRQALLPLPALRQRVRAEMRSWRLSCEEQRDVPAVGAGTISLDNLIVLVTRAPRAVPRPRRASRLKRGWPAGLAVIGRWDTVVPPGLAG